MSKYLEESNTIQINCIYKILTETSLVCQIMSSSFNLDADATNGSEGCDASVDIFSRWPVNTNKRCTEGIPDRTSDDLWISFNTLVTYFDCPLPKSSSHLKIVPWIVCKNTIILVGCLYTVCSFPEYLKYVTTWRASLISGIALGLFLLILSHITYHFEKYRRFWCSSGEIR